MQSIFDGMRAGVVAALILTLWCFLAVADSMSGGAGATGMSFVATAFGLLGLPQIFYGIGIGVVVAIWTVVFGRMELVPLKEKLADPAKDRALASVLVVFPVAVGLIGAGTMAAHLAVISGFNRAGFQAQALAMVAAGLAVVVGLLSPLLYGAVSALLKKIPLGRGGAFWTFLVLSGYGLGACLVIAGGYVYGQSLNVWSATEMQMGVAFMVLVPLMTAVMHWWRWERGAWQFGIPLAGLLIAAGCFLGAPTWAMSSAEMRAVTFRDAPILSTVARQVIDLGGDDEQIFAFADCDEDDDDCVIEVEVIEPTSAEHPARRAVALGVEAGNRAQINEFESLPDPPKNVVMILVDTLRQDHMGYAGYHRATSPNIDALAEESVVFLDAYATSPHTPRSIPPLFFSRYASQLQWYGAQYNFPRVRPENVGLFEVLQERDWKNIGIMSHFYFDERRGVNQGFDVWENDDATDLQASHTDIATPRIWGKVEPVIEELGQKAREEGEEAQAFSLFIHLFDPHAKWNYREEFGFERGSTTRERHMAAYDSEIAFADQYVGRIIDKLKEEGLFEDVIFIITSDHGEAFNEHGYYFHGQTLYNTVVNVPMLIRVPGWFSRRVEGPVSIIDIAPTLLDLVGVTIPTEFQGQSLSNVMLGREEVEDRPVFMELLPYTAFKEHHRSVVYGSEKLIVNFTLDVEELYELSEDPMEQNNLINERPERAQELRQMLDEFME